MVGSSDFKPFLLFSDYTHRIDFRCFLSCGLFVSVCRKSGVQCPFVYGRSTVVSFRFFASDFCVEPLERTTGMEGSRPPRAEHQWRPRKAHIAVDGAFFSDFAVGNFAAWLVGADARQWKSLFQCPLAEALRNVCVDLSHLVLCSCFCGCLFFLRRPEKFKITPCSSVAENIVSRS